ncbi:MAG: insulinase family protein [Pedobacter sp.]|nr:MAG: insulinase family protein [Pedobacter sp.]
MKSIQKLSILLVALFSFNAAIAQSTMKAPVRYKLKNGVTLIVAQNVGSGKIFSRLTVENQAQENETLYAQILENYMNKRAEKFNEFLTATTSSSKITMNYNEGNTATNVANFEDAFNFVSKSFLNQDIAKQAFDEMKDLYAGKQDDLKSVTMKDLQAYYNKNFKAEDTYITIAGDITPSQAREIAAKAFSNAKEANDVITTAK